MRTRPQTRLILAALLTLAAMVVAAGNFRQRLSFQVPDDGVIWSDSDGGPIAEKILPGGPGEAAGIKAGDTLEAIGGNSVASRVAISQQLFGLGVSHPATYQLERYGEPVALNVVLAPQPQPSTVRGFLQFAGVLYLVLGIYVMLRRPQAQRATHFYFFCLSSFVLLFFSYTSVFDRLDWIVYWSNVAAMLLQPALFAHLCLSYPGIDENADHTDATGRPRRGMLFTIYGSAAVLGLFHVAVATGVLRSATSTSDLRWTIDRLEVGYLGIMYVVAIGALVTAARAARSRLMEKQIAWVLMSTIVALVPFTVAYCIPYFLGQAPGAWMNASALSLIALPAGMAYAIVRYRLMDVEIALGRGLAYSLATGALVAFYLGMAALAGDFFRMYFPSGGTIGLVFAVVATGLLFQPVQRCFQGLLDRHFLRKRYEYGEALLHLGQTLSSHTQLHQLSAALLERLTSILQVSRAAIFVPIDSSGRSYIVQSAVGLEKELGFASALDFGFLRALETRGATVRSASLSKKRDYLFFPTCAEEVVERELQSLPLAGSQSGRDPWPWLETVRTAKLNYYFPCRAQNRLVAVLALGRTTEDELLSNEDASLIETLAGYLAVAFENVSLLDSLTAKAKQYEDLQQFSENILESINVGLVAVDLEDRVEAVNTQLELMYPLPFRQVRGKKLAELFPQELMTEFDGTRDDASVHSIYRHRVQMENGQERVLNIAIAPLLSKKCEWIGRLLIFDDVTDRVALETQLAQSEKLSSVGLLAAGVAHEVNTPLTVISTQAQMLAKQLPTEDKTARIVDKIIRQTFRASEIVNSLLNFSRTKAAAFSPVELNQIISETLLLLEHPLRTAHVTVESSLEPDLPLVHGSSDKLQQVFLNLFLNAKDAMPQGGRLRISTWADESRIVVEVKDTGTGIAPEHLQRIYDPFFTTKGPGRGTGLGLAVSYGIVQEHSGTIQAESRPGFGTAFRLEFPALRKPVHA